MKRARLAFFFILLLSLAACGGPKYTITNNLFTSMRYPEFQVNEAFVYNGEQVDHDSVETDSTSDFREKSTLLTFSKFTADSKLDRFIYLTMNELQGKVRYGANSFEHPVQFLGESYEELFFFGESGKGFKGQGAAPYKVQRVLYRHFGDQAQMIFRYFMFVNNIDNKEALKEQARKEMAQNIYAPK